MPTRRPQPTPQNRQGVFFQAMPFGGGAASPAAAKATPGNAASAARSAAAATPVFKSSRLVIPGLLVHGSVRPALRDTRDERQALEELHVGQRLLEEILGGLVRRVG